MRLRPLALLFEGADAPRTRIGADHASLLAILGALIAARAGGLPTYPSNVPAESTEKDDARPARRAMLRKTPSAIGERQMLPRQTQQTR
jgi:hypothetical protein